MYVAHDHNAADPATLAVDAGPLPWYRRVPAWVGPVTVGAVGLSACIYTAAVDPNTSGGIFPQCYFRQITGLDCPGCGLTRAAHSLLTGDPIGALNHNLLALVIFPVMLYAFVAWTVTAFGGRLPQIRLKPWMGWVAVVTLLAFWVVRNLPGPLHWLDSLA